jgi:signal peptidase II
MDPAPPPSWIRSLFWGPSSARGLWIALVTFALDQVHKWWMLLGYRIQDKGRVRITPFLDLVYAINPGVSYGMLPLDSPNGQAVLSVFAVAASVALAIWLARPDTNKIIGLSLGLIMGGALGNALDRLLIGGVADFFSLHAFGYYWYIFNIADVAIVAGVAGLLYDSLVASRDTASKSS